MKVSPLAFNLVEFKRVVLVVGEVPRTPLVHSKKLSDLWKSQISYSESLKHKVKMLDFNPEMDKVFEEIDYDFDKFAHENLLKHEERINGKLCVLKINEIESWNEQGVLPYLVAEARPQYLTVLIETMDLSKISVEMSDNIFANLGCLIIGKTESDNVRYLVEKLNLSQEVIDHITAMDDSDFVMYFPFPINEDVRDGFYIYEGLREKLHLENIR